jgi:uncharacterized protein YggE
VLPQATIEVRRLPACARSGGQRVYRRIVHMEPGRSDTGERWGPDVITVTAGHKVELPAKRANLHVNIRGMAYFSGQAALTKAREVGQMVTELKRYGLDDSEIRLKGVFADASAGPLGKSSSVNYELNIHCADLEKMADIVGIVSSQKNSSLRAISWEYDGEEEAQSECLVKAVEKANSRAGLIARTLGVRIVGVLNCSDSESMGAINPMPQSYGGAESRMDFDLASRAASTADFGTQFSNDRTIAVSVVVTYRISTLEQA